MSPKKRKGAAKPKKNGARNPKAAPNGGKKPAGGGAWRGIVASSLDWEESHVSLDHALDGLHADMRGRRAPGLPHSVWELLFHIRVAQGDLLKFCRDPKYTYDVGPNGYWPPTPAPPSEGAWNEVVDAVRSDMAAFATFTKTSGRDLTSRIPWGTGQTFLRTVLVAVDHNAYHVGQIVLVRRALGAWT